MLRENENRKEEQAWERRATEKALKGERCEVCDGRWEQKGKEAEGEGRSRFHRLNYNRS